MWQLAVDIPVTQQSDNTTAYLVFFGGIVATLGTIAVAWINSRKPDRSASPPPASASSDEVQQVRIDVAVLRSEHDGLSEDHNELVAEHDVLDKAFFKSLATQEKFAGTQEQIVSFLDRENPGWR